MMAALCQSSSCAADEYRLSLKTARVENEYEKALHRRNSLINDENYRLLRVNTLLVGNDNDELNGQLQRVSEQLEVAQAVESHIQAQLLEAETRQASEQNILRAKTREISNLKSEIASLNNNSLDSTKILTEKLGLSRELSSVKDELEHLRSQSESYQTLLTEKLSLERQLSSLEVELDTAKRALERARAKDASQKEEDGSTRAQLEALNKELTRERTERVQTENEATKRAAEWDTERANLESQLDAFRNELPQARHQSGDVRGGTQGQGLKPELQSDEANEGQRRQSRKRSIPHFDPDMTIGTPGDINHPKKTKLSSAGDKSMFSITPFLNRTSMSLGSQIEDSSSSGSDGDIRPKSPKKHDSTVGVKRDGPVKQKASRPKPQRATGSASQESRTSNSNQRQQTRIRGSSSISALEKVPEENDHDTETLEAGTLKFESSSKGDAQKPKVKRQKFLGASREKTLFDEDELLDESHKARRPGLGNGRSLGMRGGIHLTTAKNPRRGEALGEIGGLPEFSPLKKNKKPI